MKKRSSTEVEQRILELVNSEKPETVEQLAKLASEKLSLQEEEALDYIIRLVNSDKITLKEPTRPIPRELSAYFRSSKAYWFWITVFLSAATVTAVFTIPEETYPLVYIRYVLGSIFVLWLPGYAFVKALFPAKRDLDTVELAALSMGLSLALVPIVGLILNYTPWGIRLTPITLSLLALTLAFAAAGIVREHGINAREESRQK